MNIQDINSYLDILSLLEQAIFAGAEAWQKMRAAASAAGVPDSALADADARFQRHYSDPLAPQS